jgi:threonine dehydratase
MDAQHQLIEGAAGVAVASLIRAGDSLAGQNVVVLICGANLTRDSLRKVIE